MHLKNYLVNIEFPKEEAPRDKQEDMVFHTVDN